MTMTEGRVVPGRAIMGMSAVLVAHTSGGDIDWPAVEAHIARTHTAGLTPAVNMDTGYVRLLGGPDQERILQLARDVTGSAFVAGAFVADSPGDPFDLTAYRRSVEVVAAHGGVPVIFPSHGLNSLDDHEWVRAQEQIGEAVDRFIGFELGSMFVPYGRIYSLDAYRGLIQIPQCVGAKHSSLSRQMEWDRLAVRDAVDPSFSVFTGNDLAIDMVMYGSDYLLGLSTFAPEAFATRDRLWKDADPAFHELNDLLQYLGFFTFRPPVPAYRHDAAMFHELRGWASSSVVPASVPLRPDSDRAVLADIRERLEDWT